MKLSFSSLSSMKTQQLRLKTARFLYPERDWFLGLLIASLICIAGAGYAAYRFISALHVSGVESTLESSGQQPYARDKVLRVIDLYTKRHEKFQLLRTNLLVPSGSSVPALAEEGVASSSIPVEDGVAPEGSAQ